MRRKQQAPVLCEGLGSVRYPKLSLCKIDSGGDAPPDWIPLVPAGEVEALDGRKFKNTDPEAVVKAFNKDPREIPIDWEHATEVKAPLGDKAPAAGWIIAMEVRNGAIWGQVEWTAEGGRSVSSREYRYISPAFYVQEKSDVVAEIISAGLTNRPALDMPQLSHHEPDHGTEDTMDPKLLAALGLPEDATIEQAIVAASHLNSHKAHGEIAAVDLVAEQSAHAETKQELATARSQSAPTLDKFVPRSEFDSMRARAEIAETADKERAAAEHKALVEREVDEAQKAGKITPANREYYLASAMQPGGLALFQAFVEKAPKIAEPSDLDKKKLPKTADDLAASTVEAQVAKLCGQTIAKFETGRDLKVAM